MNLPEYSRSNHYELIETGTLILGYGGSNLRALEVSTIQDWFTGTFRWSSDTILFPGRSWLFGLYGKTIRCFVAMLYVVDMMNYPVVTDSWGIGVFI